MKKIKAKEEFCLGCRLCEIQCLVKHSKSKKIIKVFRSGEQHEIVPAVKVEESGRTSFAIQCRHCDEAVCIEACMTGAMHRDSETGAVICDQDKCVGCWMCVMVCPAGAVLSGDRQRVASKCDLCMGQEMPACVAGCPNEAIVYEDDDE